MSCRKWMVRGLVFFVAGMLLSGLFLYLSWTNPTAIREQVLDRLKVHMPRAIIDLESARLRLLGGISINELRLISRNGIEKAEFAYVPHSVISLDKELLPRVVIRKWDLPKAKLHIVRGPDGLWNCDVLTEPDLTQTVPTMVFKQATLIFEDHFNPPKMPPLEIHNLDLTMINEPLTTLVFEGTGTSDLGGTVQLHGTFERRTHDLALFVDALDLPVDGRLAGRLNHCYPEVAGHVQHLTGVAKIQAHFHYQHDAAEAWSQDVRLELARGTLSHSLLPLPLEDLQAVCRWANGRFILERLSARSGDTSIKATARALSLQAGADLEGTVRLAHLAVGPELFKAVGKLQAIEQDYHPEGFIDVAANFQRREGRWRQDCFVYPRGIALLCAKFPYRLESVGGVIEHHLDELQPGEPRDSMHLNLVGYAGPEQVHIEGRVEGAQSPSAVDVKISAKNIRIDEQLCAALKPDLQKIVRTFAPAGRVDIETHLYRPAGQIAFANRYFLQFHDASAKYNVFPYAVENLSGTLDIRPDSWDFKDFRGQHGGAEIHCQGRASCRPDGNDIVVTLAGSDLRLDEELRTALPNEALKRAWQCLSPSGQFDFQANVHLPPDNGEPDVAVTLSPRGCSLKPNFFPYTLTDVIGTIDCDRQKIVLSKVRARHGPTFVSADQAKICLKPGGGASVDLGEFTANPSIRDPELMEAVPPGLQTLLTSIQTQQPLVVRTRMTVDIPDEDRNPPYIYWDGEVGLRDASLTAGLRIQRVTGALACRGSYQGGLQGLAGNIRLDEAWVLGQPVRDMQTQILVEPPAAHAREAPGAAAHANQMDLPNLRAHLFGGDVGGWAQIKLDGGIEYDLNLIASQIRLDELGRHNNLGPKARLSGLAEGRIFLHGKGTDIAGLAGDGTVDVNNGQIYNLPLLLDLIKVLSLHLPDETAFEEAHVRYHIQGGRVEFKQLDLYGNAVSLYGKGTMNIDGTDLNLDFFPVWARIRDILPPIIEQVPAMLGQSLLKIKMRGQIGGKVECTKIPIPPLVGPMKEILRPFRNRSD